MSWHRVHDSLSSDPWAGLVAAYFLAMPVLQAVSFLTGTEFLNYGAQSWRHFVIYGVAAPWVGYLCLVRSPRARLAAYIFLSVDIFRSLAAAHFLPAALDGGLLLYLQTRHMRKSFLPMNGSEMHARLMARVSRLGALIGVSRRK